MSVTDANGCTPATASATVNAAAQPNTANAGPDAIACADALPVAVSGSVTNATSGVWTGGNGTFTGYWIERELRAHSRGDRQWRGGPHTDHHGQHELSC